MSGLSLKSCAWRCRGGPSSLQIPHESTMCRLGDKHSSHHGRPSPCGSPGSVPPYFTTLGKITPLCAQGQKWHEAICQSQQARQLQSQGQDSLQPTARHRGAPPRDQLWPPVKYHMEHTETHTTHAHMYTTQHTDIPNMHTPHYTHTDTHQIHHTQY